jgi:phage shock protein A
METELAGDEQRIRALSHELGQLSTRLADLDRSLGEIEEELDVCFGAGKDDLARALVRRRLEAQRLRKLLERKRETLTQTLAGLEARVEDNRLRLEAMRQKAELLAAEDAAQPQDPWALAEAPIRDEDVEVAFLREKQKRSRT